MPGESPSDRAAGQDEFAAGRELVDTLEALGDGAITTDRRGRVRVLNRVAEELTGWTREEAVGKPLLEVFHSIDPGTRARASSPVDELLGTPQVPGPPMPSVLVARDGSERAISANARPLRDASGTVSGAVLVFREEARRREGCAAPQEQAAMLELGRDAVIVRGASDRIILWNRGAEEVYGWTRKEALGRVAHALLKTRSPKLPAELRSTVAEAGHWQGELVQVRKDGREIVVDSHWVALRGADGSLSGVLEANRDVTAHTRTEPGSERRDARLQTVLQTTLDGFFVVDSEARLIEANDTYCSMVGYRRDELLQMRLPDLEGVETAPEVVARMQRLRRAGSSRFETRHRRKHGDLVDIDASVTFLESAGLFLCFCRDISERKRMESALRESESALRGILNAATEPISMFTVDGVALAANKAAASQFRVPPELAMGKSLFELLPEGVARSRVARLREAAQCGRPIEFEDVRDGTRFEHTFYPLFGVDGKVSRVVSYSRDVTARRQAEQALRRSRRELRALAARLQAVREEEQARIARDLHEDLGQILAGLTADLRELGETLAGPEGLPDRVGARVGDSVALLERAHASVRRIASGLRPLALDTLGLGPALLEEAQRFEEQHKVKCQVEVGILPALAPAIATALFRIAQEALANVARHAGASRATIHLESEGEAVVLRVEDDGRGLARLKGRDLGPRLGLLGMRERAWQFGGDVLLVERGACGGARLVARLPIAEKAQEVGPAGDRKPPEPRDRDPEIDLRSAERLLQDVMDGAPVAIFLKDTEGRYITVNKYLAGVHGIPREEVRGKTDFDLFPRDRAESYRAHDLQVLESGRAVQIEEVADLADGGQSVFLANKFLLRDAEGRIYGTCGISQDITAVKAAEAALRETEERFRAAFQTSPDSMTINRVEDGVYIAVNDGFSQMLGWEAPDVVGKSSIDLGVWADPSARSRFVVALKKDGFVRDMEASFRTRSGDTKPVLVSARVVTLNGQQMVLAVTRDISEQKKAAEERSVLEKELRHAQKLESIGRLAGGIAHDFNNILTVIMSCLESMRDDAANAAPANLEEIGQLQAVANRAAGLTGQLLAFARKQVIAPVTLDLNSIIRGSEKLLSRVLGEDVTLESVLSPDLWTVRCDPGQVEQVILNLAVNARDAMPDGGKLTIQVTNVEVEEELVALHPFMRVGEYVRVRVMDTGTGMASEVKEHIFEPFFTTKPQGKGTGLGLAVVYGIVKQSDGYIVVESDPGRGTAFDVYFPRSDAPSAAVVKEPPSANRGTETVLVVEDDPLVRQSTVRMLAAAGYRVVAASNGGEALVRAKQENGSLHLLLTDVIMPGLNGHELANELCRLRPGLRVLYVSGYTGEVLTRADVVDGAVEFLAKPFTRTSLLARVRAVLDGRK